MPYVKIAGRYQKVTNEELRASRYVPKNAVAIEEESGLGTAYVYPARTPGYFAVMAYRGNAAKSDFHYIYKKDTDVDRKIAEWFKNLQDHKARVSARRAEQSKPHALKVGDIVVNTWGYDQTNVDWYRITKTTTNYVWIQPIAGQTEQTGFMSGNSTPAVDTTEADLTKWDFKVSDKPSIKRRAEGFNVTMGHGCGRKWDGRSVYESWYA